MYGSTQRQTRMNTKCCHAHTHTHTHIHTYTLTHRQAYTQVSSKPPITWSQSLTQRKELYAQWHRSLPHTSHLVITANNSQLTGGIQYLYTDTPTVTPTLSQSYRKSDCHVLIPKYVVLSPGKDIHSWTGEHRKSLCVFRRLNNEIAILFLRLTETYPFSVPRGGERSRSSYKAAPLDISLKITLTGRKLDNSFSGFDKFELRSSISGIFGIS